MTRGHSIDFAARGGLAHASSSLPSPRTLPGMDTAAVTVNRVLRRYSHRSAALLIMGVGMMTRGSYLCHLN